MLFYLIDKFVLLNFPKEGRIKNEIEDDALYRKEIFIHDNPGVNTCDITIAENKGWTVTAYW